MALLPLLGLGAAGAFLCLGALSFGRSLGGGFLSLLCSAVRTDD